MTALGSYGVGTASVSNGDTEIFLSGAVLIDTTGRAGDTIIIDDLPSVEIKDRVDTQRVSLWSPWTGGNKSGVPYTIIWSSPQRISGATAYQGINDMLTKIESMGLMWYLDPAWSEPSVAKPPLVAPEGQSILKISTGQLWVMQGGVWAPAGTFKGFNFTGAWSAVTAYNASDVVTGGWQRVYRDCAQHQSAATRCGVDAACIEGR